MAFSDWDTYVQTAGTWTAHTATPIEGLQSIQFGVPGYTTGGGNAVPSAASGLTKGLTAGRLRALWRPINMVGSDCTARLICMQSADDLTSGADFYYLQLQATGGWYLHRTSGGTLSTTGTYIANGAYPFPGLGSIGSVELLWFLSVPEFGGVRFQVKAGTATDFSDLADVSGGYFDDTSGYLASSVAEGIAVENFGGGFATNILFDKVTLYSVNFA
jgi:hypothetical protein